MPFGVASRLGEHRKQAQSNLVVDHQPDHAQRGATQRIRVFRSGWLLVDRPEAGENVDLVGERDCDRHRIGGNEIVRPLRLVMILDGVGDGFVLALGLGVVAAHQPLHFGKLADHFGREIGLAKLRRALGLGDIGADERREMACKRNDARDALGLGAELFVEHDVLELRQAVFQPRLEIGLVEELRIRQPRADHALVAGDDRARRRRWLRCSTPG